MRMPTTLVKPSQLRCITPSHCTSIDARWWQLRASRIDENMSTDEGGCYTHTADCYCCYHGVLLPYRKCYSQLKRRLSLSGGAGMKVSTSDGVLVPPVRSEDHLLAQPSLRIAVNGIALLGLTATSGSAIAATDFGPKQDKACNEDFALASSLYREDGTRALFVAVADGVSINTFWPQRAARIACFAAYNVCLSHHRAGLHLDEPGISTLRKHIVTSVTMGLSKDRAALMRKKCHPEDWSLSTFNRNRSSKEFWYNTTIILAYLQESGGALFWAGDGGIAVRKKTAGGPASLLRPLTSGPDMKVSGIIFGRNPTPALREIESRQRCGVVRSGNFYRCNRPLFDGCRFLI